MSGDSAGKKKGGGNAVIVTIGGACGSGSRECAKIAAKVLGYKFFNEEITLEAYKTSSSYIDESTLRYYDENEGTAINVEVAGLVRASKRQADIFKSLSLDVLPMDLRLDAAINGALNKLVEEGDCVLIGRCANYYLRGRSDVISVYFADSYENKVKRTSRCLECGKATAARIMKKVDERRSAFYTYFTGEEWTDAGNYDVRVNCGLLGEEGSSELIVKIVELKEKYAGKMSESQEAFADRKKYKSKLEVPAS